MTYGLCTGIVFATAIAFRKIFPQFWFLTGLQCHWQTQWWTEKVIAVVVDSAGHIHKSLLFLIWHALWNILHSQIHLKTFNIASKAVVFKPNTTPFNGGPEHTHMAMYCTWLQVLQCKARGNYYYYFFIEW